MTLLAFYCSEERVLVAADGQAVFFDHHGGSPPNTIRFEKIRPIGDRPLVFAMTGPSEFQDEMDEWLQGRRPVDWRQFSRMLLDEVSRRNGEMRESIRRAGLDASKEEGSQVAVAGFLDGAPGVVVALDNGRGSVLEPGTSDFLGLHDGIARVALALVKAVVPGYELDTGAKMHAFLFNLCDRLPQLVRPVDVWEVTPSNGAQKWQPE